MAGELQTSITFADVDQITSDKLNLIIGGASFTSSAVTGSTLSVVGGKLKVGTITLSEMAASSVGTTQLVNLSVTTGKIAAGAVGTTQLANLSVNASKIALNTITLSQISTSTVATQANMESLAAGKIVTAEFVNYNPGVAKAFGEFNIISSARNIKTGYFNVSSVTRVSSTQTTVAITNNMSGTNYTVLASMISDGTETGEVAVYDKAAGSFKFKHPAEASGRAINFVVFGESA